MIEHNFDLCKAYLHAFFNFSLLPQGVELWKPSSNFLVLKKILFLGIGTEQCVFISNPFGFSVLSLQGAEGHPWYNEGHGICIHIEVSVSYTV